MPLVKRLSRIGTSSGVILDRALLKQVDLEPDAEVEVAVEGKRIVITAHKYASETEFVAAQRKVFAANSKSFERLAKR
jgi:antitoxin component of MazEF toxin-antitoxin module